MDDLYKTRHYPQKTNGDERVDIRRRKTKSHNKQTVQHHAKEVTNVHEEQQATPSTTNPSRKTKQGELAHIPAGFGVIHKING